MKPKDWHKLAERLLIRAEKAEFQRDELLIKLKCKKHIYIKRELDSLGVVCCKCNKTIGVLI